LSENDSAGASGGGRRGREACTHKKNWPLDGAVAKVFPYASLVMCPLKLFLAPYLLDCGAGTVK